MMIEEKKRKLIAIVTPTYNRCDDLAKLYESMLRQTSDNFNWYIVDDGSSDNTGEYVKQICACTNIFQIFYMYKQNGGKHTALNHVIPKIAEELTFIVDSDDSLTSDAIETIENDWNIYRNNQNLCGLSYYRLKQDGSILGKEYGIYENKVDSFVNVRINYNIPGDKAEIWKTSILRRYPFPSFKNERFLSEAIVWNKIGCDGYLLAFIPKGIYICEYLNQGLTRSGRKMRLQNPFGTLEHAKSFFNKKIKLSIRLKYYLYYVSVAIYSGKVKYAFTQIQGFDRFMAVAMIPLGFSLAIFWKIKDGDKKS